MSRETSTPLTRTFFGSTGRRKSAKPFVVVFSAIHTGRPKCAQQYPRTPWHDLLADKHGKLADLH